MYIFSILQGSVIPFFFDGISQPDLWLVFIIISAMVFPVKYAYVLSIVGGLVQDLIIGNFFGLHLLAYIVITFIFVKFVKGKYNRNWYVSVISVIVGSLAFMGISTLVMWIAGVPLVSFYTCFILEFLLLDIMQYVHFYCIDHYGILKLRESLGGNEKTCTGNT